MNVAQLSLHANMLSMQISDKLTLNCAQMIMQKQGSHEALPKRQFKKVNGMF